MQNVGVNSAKDAVSAGMASVSSLSLEVLLFIFQMPGLAALRSPYPFLLHLNPTHLSASAPDEVKT
jgi:hypothetical protein